VDQLERDGDVHHVRRIVPAAGAEDTHGDERADPLSAGADQVVSDLAEARLPRDDGPEELALDRR
jgi:hypothetical protein